ncbi:MAG: ATP-dependent Clp protease proteolytic subunit [Clostridia bacterium]|nr:ATP-dependent Clp protease proteolytic subunit [Clostridia bacterium]
MADYRGIYSVINGSDGENELSASEGFSKDELNQIEQTGTITSAKGKHIIHCLSIIGQIEGHQELPSPAKTTKYEHIMPQLVAVEEAEDIEGLIILLNTVGGDVEAGLALAELISGMKTPTVSLVLGGGHSIGVPLAVSAKRSFIVPSATMTIHPVRMSGLVLGVPQTMLYFEKMQERISRFVEANSAMSAARFNELSRRTGELVMDIGTVLDGEQAVKEGLIDELGSLSSAISSLYSMIEAKNN